MFKKAMINISKIALYFNNNSLQFVLRLGDNFSDLCSSLLL